MRGYKTLIQEAELMAMTPDAVADFLKERSGKTKDEARDYLVDEVAEQALRGRADPLIDRAIDLNPALERFLGQDKDDATSLEASFDGLDDILNGAAA